MRCFTKMIMAGAALLALAGCPTYSEESRRHAASEAETGREAAPERGGERVAEAAREDPNAADRPAEPLLEVEDVGDEEVADEGAPGELEQVMHRQGAGEPNEAGWYEATSTGGGFRVELPSAFDDYQVSDGEQVMHVLHAEADDGVRYLVQCTVGGESPQEMLATIEEQLPLLGEIDQQRRVRHAGGEGVEVRLSSGPATITIRSLALDEALCQLVIEAQGTAYPERDGARFMESFQRVDG